MHTLKLYKTHLIIILLCLIAFIFAFSSFVTKDVQAANSFGFACSQNYGKCDSDHVNLLEQLSKSGGSIQVEGDQFSAQDVVAGIQTRFGLGTQYCIVDGVPYSVFTSGGTCSVSLDGESSKQGQRLATVEALGSQNNIRDSNLCISNQITLIFPYIHAAGSIDARELMNINKGGIQNFDVSARICGQGTVAQESVLSSSNSGGNWHSWGCCHPDQVFLSQDQSPSAVDAQNISVCCPATSNLWKSAPDLSNPAGCYKATKDANGKDNPLIPTGQPIDNNVNGKQPRLGFALGTDNANLSNENFTPGSLDNGKSNLICPNTAGCAYTGQIDTLNNTPELSTLNADMQTPGALKTTTKMCARCFDINAPVGIVTSGTQKQLGLCQSDGQVHGVALINNSVSDTLAWLASDSTNKPLLESCRESGGIYIAIGCVDTTPIGVLTGIIRIAFGVMGGVALLELIIAGIYYQSGQEDKIADARNRVIATLTGLAVLVFSILILRIIGVNILDILPAGSL